MSQIDTILCDFINLAPLVFDVTDSIDRALLFKNSNRKSMFKFSYPGFGNVPLNQNTIKALYERALCTTPLSIFTEICYLVNDETSSHSTRILHDIFIYLYLVRKKFYEVQRSLAISREYINTCKIHFFYFKLNIPMADKPSQTVKRYNNHQLIGIQGLSRCKVLVDPFGFGMCDANLDNLLARDLENLQLYINVVNERILEKERLDDITVGVNVRQGDDTIEIEDETTIIEFTRPVTLCRLSDKGSEIKVQYF